MTVLDAFSRYIVHWKLLFSMTAEEVIGIVEEALHKTSGAKPEVVSDCGSQFTGREFCQLVMRRMLVEIKTRRQHKNGDNRKGLFRPKSPIFAEALQLRSVLGPCSPCFCNVDLE